MKLCREWKQLLTPYLATHDARALAERVADEYKNFAICPPEGDVFAALNGCLPQDVRVVILGQDPYFNAGQANGLAFSINPACGCTFPPSLKNIIAEVSSEMGECAVADGDLGRWSAQGVLLLNTSLTVRQGAPLSHAGIGWDGFVRAVIAAVDKFDGVVFVLWGGHARKYRDILRNPRNLVLTSAHPSPLSAHNGFFGCGHFRAINEFLDKIGKPIIKW